MVALTASGVFTRTRSKKDWTSSAKKLGIRPRVEWERTGDAWISCRKPQNSLHFKWHVEHLQWTQQVGEAEYYINVANLGDNANRCNFTEHCSRDGDYCLICVDSRRVNDLFVFVKLQCINYRIQIHQAVYAYIYMLSSWYLLTAVYRTKSVEGMVWYTACHAQKLVVNKAGDPSVDQQIRKWMKTASMYPAMSRYQRCLHGFRLNSSLCWLNPMFDGWTPIHPNHPKIEIS